ncbi:MAG: class I SAM-dependent methyltransferase [Muribaculum sp.]|nr:class I SAM-dependent methyltransferase [Muribaculum sp.]
MDCKLCHKNKVLVEYVGYIRDGRVCSKTDKEVTLYRCENCGCLFHNAGHELKSFYETDEYRKSLEDAVSLDYFYEMHDSENLDKFIWTNIKDFRNKCVADFGSGGGSFLDFLNGVASDIVAVEPTETYRKSMALKGYHTYPYASDAYEDYSGKIDIITSFDVIEHVEDPISFIKDYYVLLKDGGKGYIGTPTDAPFMRKLIGHDYEEKLLFSTQHIWIFNEKSLLFMAKEAGFKKTKISYRQRYGIGNMISWVDYKEPRGHINYDFIPKTLDSAFRSSLEDNKMSDYIILELEK